MGSKTQNNYRRNTWFLSVNVNQTFRKAVQMCVPSYHKAGHWTQLSKSVPYAVPPKYGALGSQHVSHM
jgi:hypothetical protein